jgi:ABC-type bacteriocin/lantibiotic exporter with double-glycine peptidase domain
MTNSNQRRRLNGAIALITADVILTVFSANYLFFSGSTKEGILFSIAGVISILALIDLRNLKKSLKKSIPEPPKKNSLLDDPYFIDRAGLYK